MDPSTNAPALLEVRQIEKRYGDFVALHPTSLSVRTGEFLTLLGPSGSGKTTLLGLISGLTEADEGSITIGDVDVTDRSPHTRGIGMVFQNYALFPHLTVAENIAFPLRLRRIDAHERDARVRKALELVDLPHLGQRFPRELSGGQQQRIALARCIVYEPKIILMDEPLGALDKRMRDQMQFEIRRIHRELGTTIIYVTHDQEEAMTMSDRICLMRAGGIEQLGSPADLYFRPHTTFVADFIGESNLFVGTVIDAAGDEVTVRWRDMPGTGVAKRHDSRLGTGDQVQVMVRPQSLSIDHAANPANDAQAVNVVATHVLDFFVAGDVSKYRLMPKHGGGKPISVTCLTQSAQSDRPAGHELAVRWHARDAVALPDSP
ncbi:ABC transporter ATP-binding protein [Paraburkholderia sediminicola]|uniref:ABC transporter ATP-binding protein n=1 Tax=Paraburkholderia sediminicola TaxID=458836 RepID=UPI0038B92C31